MGGYSSGQAIQQVQLVDRAGAAITSSNGGVDVNIQDQVSQPIHMHFAEQQGATLELDAATVVDAYTLDLVDASTVSAGDFIRAFGTDGIYEGEVLSKLANQLAMDTPINIEILAGRPVIRYTKDMNVNGSSTVRTFSVKTGGTLVIDITDIAWRMVMTAAGDDSKFGDQSALTKGVILRKKLTDGTYWFLGNFKNNGQLIQLDSGEDPYTDKAGGGKYGFRTTHPFAGQNERGVAIRLSGTEELQILIQDAEPATLIEFDVLAMAHVVVD